MKSAWLFPALEGTKASVENDPRDLSVDWRVRCLPLVRLRLTGPKVGALPRTTAAREIALWRTGREQEQKQTPSHWYSIVFLIRNSHHEISYSLQKIRKCTLHLSNSINLNPTRQDNPLRWNIAPPPSPSRPLLAGAPPSNQRLVSRNLQCKHLGGRYSVWKAATINTNVYWQYTCMYKVGKMRCMYRICVRDTCMLYFLDRRLNLRVSY